MANNSIEWKIFSKHMSVLCVCGLSGVEQELLPLLSLFGNFDISL